MKRSFVWFATVATAFLFLALSAAETSVMKSGLQAHSRAELIAADLDPQHMKGMAVTSREAVQKMPGGVGVEKRSKLKEEVRPPQSSISPLPETLACDDGTPFEPWNNGAQEWSEAVRLIPLEVCSLEALLYWPSDPLSLSPNLTWGVWDDDGPGGFPGTLLDSGTVAPIYDTWFRVDLVPPISIPNGEVIYAGWLDANGEPWYYNYLDTSLDSCNYWFDGLDWILDEFFDGDFLVRGICGTIGAQNDVAMISINDPPLFVPRGASFNPGATVRNLGTNLATFNVICNIDSMGSQILVYSDTVSITDLPSAADTSITFPQVWNAADAVGIEYLVTVYTTLGGDENPGNDTLTATTVTADTGRAIHSPYTANPPTIDGFMGPGEWSDAACRDVSDLLGMPDSPNTYGSAYLCVMNDASNLYVAVDGIHDATEDDYDEIGLYFDDDHDHVFPSAPDTSEGNFWLYRESGLDVLEYRWIQDGPVFGIEYDPGFPHAIDITSGHQQFELQLPLGPLAEELNASPADTVGLWLYGIDGSNFLYFGWWPYDIDDISGPYTPSEYADVILGAPPAIHDGSVISIDSPQDTVCTDSTYTPCVTVVNFGNTTETFDAYFSIPAAAYDETTTVTDLAPSETTQVCFPNWTVPSLDSTWYPITSCVLVPGDTGSSNDCITDSVFAYMCDVGIEEGWKVLDFPRVFALGQSSPNPFHQKAEVRYQIPVKAEVSLKVYDLSGRLVSTLIDGTHEPGHYTVPWDGKNQSGLEVPSGVYLYRIKAGEFVSTKKLILVR